jgi:putative ABC transport system permease protein
MRLLDAIRARLGLVLRPGAAETRMEEEIRFHVEMEAERLEREEGLDAVEARRRALVAFGGLEKTKEELRAGRGLAWLSGLRLDLKLGARQLVKYPVLSVASVLALTVAVALAGSWFEFTADMTRPRIPLPDADRLVAVRNLDLTSTDRDYPSEPRALHDFETWRAEVGSLEHLTAVSPATYSVSTAEGALLTLSGARVTPSLFRLTGVRPLLGRPLVDADDRAGADLVAVIGHDAWHRLFRGDPSAIGQTVHLGAEPATVVGVMPVGYGFPLNHEIWTPLRETALSYARREGPAIRVYGRLAPGVSLREARAELEVVGRRAAAEYPATHGQLQPEIRRYARGGDEGAIAALLNIPFLLFLVVVSANVATLLFARATARESELALRSALGASRRRIVVHLIGESLVLTGLAAVLGLAVAAWGIRWGMGLFWEIQQMRPPFWFDPALSASTVAYVAGLAVVGAIIIGGGPALRATRSLPWQRIGQPGAGRTGMRFGSVTTGAVVLQVALCVAFLPVAVNSGRTLLADTRPTDFPAGSFLSGRVAYSADAPDAADSAGPAASTLDEVGRRLAAEPGVVAVTRVNRLPGFNHPVEAIAIPGDSAAVIRARTLAVDPDFFAVVGARVVAGRSFQPEDATSALDVAVVDRDWAGRHFDGRSAVGERLEVVARDGTTRRAYEIVGLVEGMGRVIGPGTAVSVYRPFRPEEHQGMHLYLRTADDPETLAARVQEIVIAVDPALGVADVMPLDDVWRPVERSNVFFTLALAMVAGVILLFALIGIYALMSFTVARRTREIGIRAALGADPRRILLTIFSRAMAQIGLGVVIGATLISLTLARSPDGLLLVAAVAAAMLAVGLMGCVVPALRALRIEPTAALRAE